MAGNIMALLSRGSATTLRTRQHASTKPPKKVNLTLLSACVLTVSIILVLSNLLMLPSDGEQQPQPIISPLSKTTSTTNTDTSIIDSCRLRQYPPRRYYKLNEEVPDFLQETEYIYGEWPVILSVDDADASSLLPSKLCIDQSAWHTPTTVWPFADGTNPSILTVKRIREHQKQHHHHNVDHDDDDDDALWKAFPQATYMATACMTNSQCAWKDSPQEQALYHINASSSQIEPDAVLTVLLLLDQHFQTIAQTTLTLERNAQWGKRVRAAKGVGKSALHATPALDDARLFLHQGHVWLSFREGKGFGWDAQVLNKIHWQVIEKDGRGNGRGLSFRAWLRASETTSFCCGRNMALMEDRQSPDSLLSLTWVDPVTVETVDTTPLLDRETTTNKHRRLQQKKAKKKKKKSHVHGTNAFMVYLPDSDEFLGLGHFHRPNDRKPNPYARFGHHYTHMFFTVSAQPPWQLTGLSPEWVLPSATKQNDAEIIQFASGLELLDDDHVLIAYGINDCEAAVTKVSLKTVRSLLRKVEAGKQVVDYMQPLRNKV